MNPGEGGETPLLSVSDISTLLNSAICLTARLTSVRRGPESYGVAPGVGQRAGISAEDLTSWNQGMAHIYTIQMCLQCGSVYAWMDHCKSSG